MANLTTGELSARLFSEQAGWSANDNPVSMMNEDVRKRLLGRDQPQASATVPAMRATAGAAPVFDQFVDWRNRNGGNHITPVKNQVSCGSCVSFCTVAVTEAMAHIEKNVWLDLSEADQHFCSSHGPSCGGWNDADAFVQIKNRGVSDEACFPYNTAFPNNDPGYYYGHNEPPHPTCRTCADRDARAVKITNILNFGANQAAIKNHLTKVGPVSCSFEVFTDFFNYSSGIYRHISGVHEGYHCVTVIGYSEAEQSWICKNSWGSAWGMGGFFKIAYGQCQIDSFEKIGVTGVVIPNPQHVVSKVTLGEASFFAPAITQLNGHVYIAWTGVGNNQLNVMSSGNGVNFVNKATLGEIAVGSPALTSFNGKIYLAWTGTDARHSLNIMSSVDGINFGNKVTLADSSFTAPALGTFNGRLYLAWTGNDSRHSLNVISSLDGIHFDNKVTLADTSFTTPSLSSVGGKLYLAWAGNDAAHSLNLLQSTNGVSYTNKITFAETSGSGPSVSSDGNLLWIGWSGTGNLRINFMTQPATASKITLGDTAIGTPASSYPFFAWAGTDTQHHINIAKFG
jgi:C1A family cysteine protease